MIIVVDLDDTLLNSEHKVSDYDLNVLKKAKTKGHKIVVSTLRSLVRCLDISKYIDADVTSCFLGNLCISNTGDVIKSNPLPFKDFEKVIQSFKSVYDGWIGFESDKMSVLKCWHFFCRTVVLYVLVLMWHSGRLYKIIKQ